MGRHERPLDPGAGPIEALAHQLRELRVRAGTPRYRELARRAGYSASALSAAASGAALPSLELVLAYAGSCGGDLSEWESRWRAASAALGRLQPVLPSARPTALPDRPTDEPAAVPTVGETLSGPTPVASVVARVPDQPHVFAPLTGSDPRQAGPYRLRARLGVGSMSRVYLAYTPGGRALAVKIIRPELAEDSEFRLRFAQEVKVAGRLSGVFTAQVLDADPDASLPWLATAYVAGPSVHEAVTEWGPLPVSSMWLFTAGVAEALQTVQAAGIVHRDLTPSNVLLAGDGPRLIDFGIARASDASRLTRTGIQIGSPQFMAPEHARGQPPTFAADVFTLGALVVFAATGHAPFGDGADVAVLYRVVHEPPDLGDLSADLREIAAACLRKDPAARPRLADVIAACQEHSGVTSLKISSSWLPDAVTADIHRRAAAAPPR